MTREELIAAAAAGRITPQELEAKLPLVSAPRTTTPAPTKFTFLSNLFSSPKKDASAALQANAASYIMNDPRLAAYRSEILKANPAIANAVKQAQSAPKEQQRTTATERTRTSTTGQKAVNTTRPAKGTNTGGTKTRATTSAPASTPASTSASTTAPTTTQTTDNPVAPTQSNTAQQPTAPTTTAQQGIGNWDARPFMTHTQSGPAPSYVDWGDNPNSYVDGAKQYAAVLAAGRTPVMNRALADAMNREAARSNNIRNAAMQTGDVSAYMQAANNPQVYTSAMNAIAQGTDPKTAFASATAAALAANGQYRMSNKSYVNEFLPAADRANDAHSALGAALGISVAPQRDYLGNVVSSYGASGATVNADGTRSLFAPGGNIIHNISPDAYAASLALTGANGVNAANAHAQALTTGQNYLSGVAAGQAAQEKAQLDAHNARMKNASDTYNQQIKNTISYGNLAARFRSLAGKGDTGGMSVLDYSRLAKMADDMGVSIEEVLQQYQNFNGAQ